MLFNFDLGNRSFLVNSQNKAEIENEISNLKTVLLALEDELRTEERKGENSFSIETLKRKIEKVKGVLQDLFELLSEEHLEK